MSARPRPTSSFAAQRALVLQGMQASMAARTKAGWTSRAPNPCLGSTTTRQTRIHVRA